MNPSYLDEEDILLLKRLMSGDDGAYNQLCNKYCRWLIVSAIAVLGKDSEAVAQDLVQELLINFWHRKLFLKLHPPYPVRSYLFQSIRHRCISEIRSGGVARRRAARFAATAPSVQPPEYLAEHKELQQALVLAAEKVPPLSAKVFRLAYLEQKSRLEIAAEMGISPHTVRNQLQRAVSILRKYLRKP